MKQVLAGLLVAATIFGGIYLALGQAGVWVIVAVVIGSLIVASMWVGASVYASIFEKGIEVGRGHRQADQRAEDALNQLVPQIGKAIASAYEYRIKQLQGQVNAVAAPDTRLLTDGNAGQTDYLSGLRVEGLNTFAEEGEFDIFDDEKGGDVR